MNIDNILRYASNDRIIEMAVTQVGYIDIYEPDPRDLMDTYTGETIEFDVRGHYDTASKLLRTIQRKSPMFRGSNIRDFIVDDGELSAYVLITDDYEYATKEQLTRWRNGEIHLFYAHLHFPLEVISSHAITDEEARFFGLVA